MDFALQASLIRQLRLGGNRGLDWFFLQAPHAHHCPWSSCWKRKLRLELVEIQESRGLWG